MTTSSSISRTWGGSIGDTPGNGNGGYAIASLVISGDRNTGAIVGTTGQRDRLTINDFTETSRQLDYFYLNDNVQDFTQNGSVNVTGVGADGLFGANLANGVVQVREMETYIFNAIDNFDDGDTLDTVRIFGATDEGATIASGATNPDAAEIINIALLPDGADVNAPGGPFVVHDQSALVYRNGAPYLGTPPLPYVNPTNRPGLSGTGTSTDMLINGMNGSIFVTSNNDDGTPVTRSDDQVVVSAASENPLDDGATVNRFNFGGVFGGANTIHPGFGGAGTAYDAIVVADGQVATSNSSQAGAMLTVTIDTQSFLQNLAGPPQSAQQNALIVNGGDEAAFNPVTNVADDFAATISLNFNIQVNGNLPVLTFAGAAKFSERQGDQLVILPPVNGSLNIYSDDSVAVPNVSVGATNSVFVMRNSSIERLTLDAAANGGQGRVNIVGDNNDPTVDQNDYFRIRGRDVDGFNGGDADGANELQLEIGGSWDPVAGTVNLSPPIFIRNATRLNISGGEIDIAAGNSGYDAFNNAIPVTTDTGVDVLDITAWAENTPRGWGVETFFNEGDSPASDGGVSGIQIDLVIFNGFGGVAENIVIQPSGLTNGQIYSNNAATGTPIAVVNYLLNSNIIVNGNDGSLGDADTLTLRGTDPANPGTTGIDNVFADFTLAGDAANPMVRVYDGGTVAANSADTTGVAANVIYNLQDFTNFDTINFNLLGGADSISVVGRNDGSLTVNVDGGSPGAGDTLNVSAANVAVTFGALASSGMLATSSGNVNFTGIESIGLLGDGTGGLTINGTNANNAIDYAVNGPSTDSGFFDGFDTAIVSVDAHAAIEFSDYDVLNLNAGAGDDVINVNHGDPGAVSDPTSLITINVDGGAPTASDTVIVSGFSLVPDTLTFTPLSADSADVEITGRPIVHATTTELVVINGLAGNDNFDIFTPSGADTVTLTPGATVDSGSVQVGSLVAMSFTNIGTRGGPINFLDADDERVDTLIYNGTSANDTFDVNSSGDVNLNSQLRVTTPGIIDVVLNGFAGDDTFNVTDGDGLPFDTLTLAGGDPSNYDVANIEGDGSGLDITLGNPNSVPEHGIIGTRISGGGFSTINLPSVEVVNVENPFDGAITAHGTNGIDDFTVSNVKPNRATIQLANLHVFVNLFGAEGGPDQFNIEGGGPRGRNTLTYVGNPVGQTYSVTGDLVDASGSRTINYTNFRALTVVGGPADDTFDVTPSADTTIFVDGGDPIGNSAGDTIVLNPSGFSITETGPERDEGGLVNPGNQRVSWDHIERVVVAGGGTGLTLGTNGDDDITIIARDASYDPTADGVQDYTVSVNGGAEILYIDFFAHAVDALAGDDDIVVREPAPNPDGEWNVQVYVAGGTPAAATGDQGDVLEVETPGTQTVNFTPNPSAISVPMLPAGFIFTPVVGGIDTAIIEDITNTSAIAAAPFSLSVTIANVVVFAYTSSPGGVEQVVYQGMAGGDTLTINGTSSDDTTTVNPTGAGSGNFRSGLSPIFDFAGATDITINGGTGGFDVVNIYGTAGGDTVTSGADTVSFTGAGSVTFGTDVDRMNLYTSTGNDSITLSLGVEALFKFIDAGADDDTVDLSGVSDDATILGGDGDDTLIGSPTADFIDSGKGNDNIVGLGGNDTVYAGEGNDTIIFAPGDGTDVAEGGAGSDLFVFIGTTGDDDIDVSALGSAAVITNNSNTDEATLTGIERLTIGTDDSDTGDIVIINSLTATELKSVIVDGDEPGTDLNADALIINATDGAETVTTNPTQVLGLGPVINIANFFRIDGDNVTVNLLGGSDLFTATAAGDFLLTVNGGSGADVITSFDNINGDAGDDLLTGSAGNDTFDGGDGEDTIIATRGDDTINGGADFDRFLIRGTSANDVIDVFQEAPTGVADSGYALTWIVNGVTTTVTFTQDVTGSPGDAGILPTMEEVRIEAGRGNDLIRVGVSDVYSDLIDDNGVPNQAVRFHVLGDAPNASDRLVVSDDGLGDLVLLHQAPDQRSGRVSVAPGATIANGGTGLGDVVYEGIERVDITPLNTLTSGTGTDGNGRLVVFHADPHEVNDARLNAGQLARVGQSSTSPNIAPGADATFDLNGDEDWYEFRPTSTNTFQIKILFDRVVELANGRPGLPGDGDLSLDIYDATGMPIVSGVADGDGNNRTAVFGATNDPAFPEYNRIFIRVKGAGDQPTLSINRYDFDNLSGLGSGSPGVGVLDQVGPQITGVEFPADPTINIFAPKPVMGPSPLVQTIDIRFADRPARVPGFLYSAIDPALFNGDDMGTEQNNAPAMGLFSLVGDRVGNVPIVGVGLTNDAVTVGQFGTAAVRLYFDTTSPLFGGGLPDDRYTLTILDSLTDPAGNRLDGESNAAQPNNAPSFPTGNGHAGGNFVARFSVNSRPHIGTFGNGTQQLDINGNGIWDPLNADTVNADKQFAFGRYTDNIFAGDFARVGQNGNGFDKLGAYGMVDGRFRFLLATGGVVDNVLTIIPTLQINGRPLAYDFNPSISADEIAIFDGQGNWYIDFNHTNNLGVASTLVIRNGLRGFPVVGDFDGSGTFDLATYQPDTNTWQFDLNPTTSPGADATFNFGFAGVMERPVAADMNHDGITDIGLFVPTSTPGSSTPGADWYILGSPGPGALPGFVPGPTSPYLGTLNAIAHAFNPAPFSQDQFFHFGNGFLQPIVGNWDPPAPPAPPVLKLSPGTFTDVSVSALVDNVPSGGSTGLLARRSTNGKNEVWGGIARNGNAYTAQIRLLQNGAWKTLVSVPITALTGRTSLKFDVVGTSLELSVNGSLVASTASAAVTGAGSVGAYFDVGSIIWPTEAVAISRPVITLPFSDSFTQADGKLLDPAWNQWTGSFRTQGNVLIAQDAANLATLYSAAQTDSSQSVQVTTLPAGGIVALVARYNSVTGSLYRGGLTSVFNATTRTTTYFAQIWRKQGATWTQLASTAVSAPTGTLTFVTVGASQRLFLNGTLVAASTDAFLKTGNIGIYSTKAVAVDNYSAFRPTLSTTSLPFADSFAGSALGSNWYANGGGFSVIGGKLVGVGSANEITLYGATQLNVAVQANLLAVPGGTVAGVFARYNVANGNTYWAGITASYNAATRITSYTAQIKRRVNGVWTVLFTKSAGVQPGLIRLEVSGNQLTLALNGTQLGSVRDAMVTAAGTVGISGGKGTQVSGFSAS